MTAAEYIVNALGDRWRYVWNPAHWLALSIRAMEIVEKVREHNEEEECKS